MAGPSHNPYSRPANPPTRSYDSSSVSAATSPRALPPFYRLPGTGARSNVSPLPHPIGIPPLLSSHHPHQATFQTPYTPVTAGSIMGRESLASNDSSAATPTLSSAQLPSSANAQKRAYRQRRKDPSCDACRERKVKCDATDANSCSECSSRNVKCQFTKETNRRMSSMKQLQDLDKQLNSLRRENANLRRVLQDRGGHLEVDADSGEQPPFHLADIGTNPRRKTRPSPIHHLARARANIRSHSRGLWKAPASFRQPSRTSAMQWPKTELPPKAVVDKLLFNYYTTAHTTMPVLHWRGFQQSVEDLYQHGMQQHEARSASFMSMFFAVLAVGSIFESESVPDHHRLRGTEMVEAARQFVDVWVDDYELDHARTFALIAYYLGEINMKSAGCTWLGMAVSAAHDLGLHLEEGRWPVIEHEMRRRTWWMIYVLDRSLALELGRPTLIDDSDCDVTLPAAVDDHYILETGIARPNGAEPLTHTLLAVVHVVRSYASLNKSLSSPVIAPTRLATFDQHFNACWRAFPPTCDTSSSVRLPSYLLNAAAYLLHARLLLHRHNLSPACPGDVRQAAIDQCTHTALETAAFVARSDRDLPTCATSTLLLHIFRCTLFLILEGHGSRALTCIRALASVKSRPDVIIPCGRYLTFFLDTVLSKRADIAAYYSRQFSPEQLPSFPYHQGVIRSALLQDEELLAYVSADLQASPETAWVWAGGEGEVHPTPAPVKEMAGPPNTSLSQGQLSSTLEARVATTRGEQMAWAGWERLEGLINELTVSEHPQGPAAAAALPNWASPAPPHSLLGGAVVKTEQGTHPGPTLPPISVPGPPSRAHSAGDSSSQSSPTTAPRNKGNLDPRLSIANMLH